MAEHMSLEFRDRAGWRRWLERHHAAEKEAWITIQKAGSPMSGVTYEEAVEEAMCFGWIDSRMRSVDEHRFIQRFSPRRKNSPWALTNRERAERLIAEGKMAPAGLKAVEEAKRSGRWSSAYTSKVAPKTPEDLEEALRKDEAAWANFNGFPNSVKLMYVFWVEETKRAETTVRRIKEVVKRASRNIRPG
jgi:uncharacterized protein YdeI (YjbR/CyaY-like superfamily)